MSEKTDIKSMDLEELKTFFSDMGEKAFRAKQVYEWLHVRQVESFEEMTNLSKTLRERLDETCRIITLRKEQVQISKLDGTRKYLFLLEDGNVIESVLMKYKHGLVRGLAPAEMLDQIYQIGKDIGERISNVVVMGTGEPMDNFDNLVKFITLLTDENGLHISQRNLTVSTCGIVPRMRELADKKLAITLALSLHASNQKKRLELMPVANKYDIHEVIDACRYYFEQTGRRVTFEYCLVGGVNDTKEDAKELTELIHGMNCHVNLIPVNPIRERDYVQSNAHVIEAFKEKLERSGLTVTVRREMGRDIDGACGQLRRKYKENQRLA